MKNDPDILVELMTTATDFDAEVVAAALREEGIPATVFARATSVLQGQVSPLPSISVSVRRADLERAKSVLIEIRRAALELDWSQVDTQDPTPVSEEERSGVPGGKCPRCRYDRRGIAPSASCPECGSSPMELPVPVPGSSARPHRVRKALVYIIVMVAIFIVVDVVRRQVWP